MALLRVAAAAALAVVATLAAAADAQTTATPAADAMQLPPTWPRCRRKDPNLDYCLRHATQITLEQLAEGAPGLGLEPVEPVPIEETFEVPRRGGRVSLKMALSNLTTYGLTGARIYSVFSDIDRSTMDFYFVVPIAVVFGKMEVEGRILHEPVGAQKGNVNFTFYDAEGFLTFSGETASRDGSDYLEVTETTVDVLSLGGLTAFFDQLDNSSQRNAKLNFLLNSNALALWPTLRDSMSSMLASAFQRMANQVFGKVPIKDIFLADDHPAVQNGPSAVLLPAAR